MRFALSESSEYISIGNTTGSIFVFKLNDVINPESSSIGEDFNYSYNIKEIQTYNTTVKSLIRQVSFHPEMSFLAYCNDDGDIFINDINK